MNIEKFRPIPFFFITTDAPEELTYEKVYSSLEKLKADGFGGFILFNKPPHGFTKEKYLGDEWFLMVRNFLRAAKELSLRVWINDGFNYPPGSVAGKIKDLDDSLSQKRVIIRNGECVFEKVDWGYPAFELPRSSELFIELVYEAYEREVGEYFGNVIEGFFSDADNRRINSGVWDEDSPERDFFPWSDNFSEEFEKKYGYDIKQHLIKIVGKSPCKEARDYWECASSLYQRWFENNYKWLKSRGLKYSFHTSDSSPDSMESCPRSSVFTEGRALDVEQNCDFPGTDQELLDINANNIFYREKFYEPEVSWGDDDRAVRNDKYCNLHGDVRSKQASSTAFLYDKKTALCEMFAASNWGATYDDLRAIALWQVMQGIGFIVPHAYHYRLLGKTKYFAPPAFCEYSHLNEEIRQFNDTLATYAAICNDGSLVAPIALLDITEELWLGNDLSKAFLDTAEALNRLPYGYVISDMKGIERKRGEFKVAINPGITLTDEFKKLLSEKGITVINHNELSKLDSIIPLGISFKGCGTPHFMRRNTDRGELVIVGNTENPNGVCGTLTVNEKKYEIELCIGELAYFFSDECHYRCSLDFSEKKIIKSFDKAEIIYKDENILPIERWMDENSRAITKDDEGKSLNFTYTVCSSVGDISLYISKRHMEIVSEILIDGIPISESEEDFVFDDKYVCFTSPKLSSIGRHKITVLKDGILSSEDRIFLRGDFDLRLTTAERFYKKTGWHYNMYRYIPRLADVFLEMPAREVALCKSWAEQGRPFYSGSAIYKFDFSVDEDVACVLRLPKVGFLCRVYIDGNYISCGLWQPYVFNVDLTVGKHEMQIEVVNTMANSMEFYRAPSGILDSVVVYER